VFDTGSFSDPKWKNVEALGTKNWYVQKSAIESFGVLPKSK
jgi:hypothetical protein